MSAEKHGRYDPEHVAKDPETRLKRIAYRAISWYLHARHKLKVEIHPDTTQSGPVFAVSNHTSLLDVAGFMIGDPYYPSTIPIIDAEQFKNFLFKFALNAWGAISLDRQRRDVGVVGKAEAILDKGGSVCIAGEGTRTRTGHLWPMDDRAVRLTLREASRGIPVNPIVAVGAYECLPPGVPWYLTKAGPLEIKTGPPIDLSPWVGKRLQSKDLEGPAAAIQAALADLLPLPYKPLPGTPPVWTSNDYQPLRGMRALSRDQVFDNFADSIQALQRR